MEDCSASSESRNVKEQQQTLDLINEREEESDTMKQNLYQPSSTTDPDVVDGVKCDDETPSPPGDDVALENDDGVENSRDPDYVEERFRVDRRKLEQLIQVSEDEEENAEEFFKKIMNETNTHIAWPSKLKIGAKSKKDPHIKVSGHKDAVSEAKMRILAILDTKSQRVTLKMDVSHTEHSHVIGKSGHNIKRVMQETGCHIHFPDSNRNNQAEKSNQVSIAGQCEGVELARTRIRELLPLVFMFEVPMTNPNQANIDANSAVIQNIQHHCGVSISIKPHHQTYTRTVVVRGSVYNSKAVKKAAATVFELLTGKIGEAFGVSMLLDIAAQHHYFIIGHGGANINRIMQQTGATIHFPDPTAAGPQRRGTVYITGTMSSVFLARRQLLGCLPLVLMFDLKDDVEVDQGMLSQLMEQLDVFISIKPKPKQTAKSVIVKTIESNTGNVYEARRRILGLSQETPMADNQLRLMSDSDLQDEGLELQSKSIAGTCSLAMSDNSSPVPLELQPTSMTNVVSPNPVFRPMVMLPHQGTLRYPPSFPAPPVCYLPPQVPQEWSPYPTTTLPLLQQQQQQHQQQHPASFLLSPNQGPNTRNVNEDLFQHVTGALSVPPMPTFSPSNTTISNHNIRNVAEFVLPPPAPSSSLPLSTPLSLDLLASEFVSNISECPSSVSTLKLDSLTGMFDAKPVGRDSMQHPLLRNHITPTLAGFTCLRSNIPVGPFSSAAHIAPGQLYPPSENGCSPLNALYFNRLPSASCSVASAAAAASSSSSSSPPSIVYHAPHQHYPAHQTQHDGIFQMMSDHNNDVYPSTPIANSALDMNAAAHGNYHPHPLIYANGTKETVEEERHDLLDEKGQRNFSVENGDVDRDGECESDSSSERSINCKAPGSNRPKKSINTLQFEASSLLNDVDYERKKMLAIKAMQKKPVGESRIPTDYWAGYGFSLSMPAPVIRERLNLNDSCYEGSKMTTPYEDAEEDGETWKNASNHESSVTSDNLMNLVSQLSAQCQDLSLQPDTSIGQMDGCRQLGSKSSSSIWQPLDEKRVDRVVIGDTDLSLLFSEMGLGKYTEHFKQQEIDMATFLTLTDQDLKDLGISTFGARRKMLLVIADLNKRQSVLPPPPGLPNPFRDSGIIRRHDIVSQSVRW